MSRRRAFGLTFGLLIAVYVLASVVTVVVVRDRLQDAVDRDLRTALDGVVTLVNALDPADIDTVFEFDVDNERALIIMAGRDEIVYVPAGLSADPLPHPDVTASMIVNRDGTPFQVDSLTGDVDYRVLTARLDDGSYIALAQPLDGLQEVVYTLRFALLVTLFSVVTMLGAVFWMILHASLRPYDDMIATAEAIAHGDLDRRATAPVGMPEIGHLAGALNTMLDRIQESFKAKESAEARLKQFLADASHELRTPLTSIRGYSELYLSGTATDPTSINKQMTRINAESARMGRLVDDLLTLARLDQIRRLEPEPVDLSAITADAVDDARAASPRHRIDANLGTGAAFVDGDPDALRQLVGNLLTNARTHTPPGTTITVTLETIADTTQLGVADTGPGISSDRAAGIFDRFDRAPTSNHSSTEGTGLAIAAAIAAAHHGTIEHSANQPTGAIFTVHLPRIDTPTNTGSKMLPHEV